MVVIEDASDCRNPRNQGWADATDIWKYIKEGVAFSLKPSKAKVILYVDTCDELWTANLIRSGFDPIKLEDRRILQFGDGVEREGKVLETQLRFRHFKCIH